jgi:hypothetical protein
MVDVYDTRPFGCKVSVYIKEDRHGKWRPFTIDTHLHVHDGSHPIEADSIAELRKILRRLGLRVVMVMPYREESEIDG